MAEPLAIVCADLHLSLYAPTFRSTERDWFAAMLRPLERLKETQKRFNLHILCAGDVFNDWKAPPQLVNWAIENLPEMWAVPGQHDLPYHSLDQIHLSAFQTLVLAGKLEPFDQGGTSFIGRGSTPFWVGSAGWGARLPPPPASNSLLKVGVVHRYLFVGRHGYQGAPSSALPDNQDDFAGYDVIVSGDNHNRFECKLERGGVLWNCGSMMRRAVDQISHCPRIGVLWSDGRVVTSRLPITDDQICIPPTEPGPSDGVGELLREVVGLGDSADFDFRTALRRLAETKTGLQRQYLLDALEHAKRSDNPG
jgi:hypothetical protein